MHRSSFRYVFVVNLSLCIVRSLLNAGCARAICLRANQSLLRQCRFYSGRSQFGYRSGGAPGWQPFCNRYAHPKKATKPMPVVEQQIVAACKAQNPNFGPGGRVARAQFKAPQCTLPATPPTKLANAQHPNIVFILTDDLAMNLVQYMHHATSQADPTE